MLVLDVVWLMAFSSEIRNVEQIEDIKLGKRTLWSIELGWWLELLGFLVRCVSAVLWWKMWMIGSQNEEASYSPVGFDQRRTTSPEDSPRNSGEVLGGSIYNPTLYASVFHHNYQPYYHPPVSILRENQVEKDDVIEGKQRASDREEDDLGNAA
ncbi:hypothetical protein CBR_g37640 [Chara braunii]|uniref:Uncharacterized protein n=1 Tax=Chara braunii TaxID=69332 RepID=A0A388LNJ8_CHABU|nr:hypothetical protein CBR_g37640 [Chara braunii]|eukprot:GBG83841.1 hypothetical protein CBR_g37640 [Chara braunii]